MATKKTPLDTTVAKVQFFNKAGKVISEAIDDIAREHYSAARAHDDAKRRENELNNARDQAIAQLESIVAMVAALECDYNRLEELREESSELPDGYEIDAVVGGYIWKCAEKNKGSDRFETEETATYAAWAHENPADAEELAELETTAGDCTDSDDAYQRIQEDPLSVQVRSGWYSPGETPEPAEFEILLCTGGPAVRILGELDEHNQPSRAWIQYQDWGTPWTDFYSKDSTETLLTYCNRFYFGE